MLCCGYTLTDFPISIRLTSLALRQSNDCPSASKATLMNMDKYFMWIHHEQLHNHNKAKHNKTVCIFLGIYCISTACLISVLINSAGQQLNIWNIQLPPLVIFGPDSNNMSKYRLSWWKNFLIKHWSVMITWYFNRHVLYCNPNKLCNNKAVSIVWKSFIITFNFIKYGKVSL